jgi:hypothetical protein
MRTQIKLHIHLSTIFLIPKIKNEIRCLKEIKEISLQWLFLTINMVLVKRGRKSWKIK